jgi:quercetin dioxygenase-like cupin family protein
MKNLWRTLWISALLVSLLLVAGCSSAPTATSQVVTVVNTVPVEVTRVVEVLSTVEITREVIVTQIVEIPVTVTPTVTSAASATPEPTATLQLLPTYTPLIPIPTDYDPTAKEPGFAPLKVINETSNTMTVVVSGPVYASIVAPHGGSVIQVVAEGSYQYTVWQGDTQVYAGEFSVTNPDKHELILRTDKAVFRMP